ncbi:TrkH family potassium uptake protein [Amorphus orientalis]|uniref:Trk system potassium uptake protein n=1 Tax=Amorphus orientalis TaxID=649198 RepID=A0AAE3VQN7_9HYPH|nr:TrkH family potassium uptake protein [Amorphus orientalis]MDQ0316929.1 trk system potassium uptake protein TrkH [Amorphus orientalis]
MQALQYLRPSLYIASFFALHIAVAMLIPAFIDIVHGNDDWAVFMGSSVGVFALALLGIVSMRQPLPKFSPRFGFLLTTVLWLVTGFVSAIPFWLSPLPITASEGFFEAMSGLTTTGSTVLTGLDTMPKGILIWRSMLQWIGGIGIVAIGLFLFPFLRIGGMQFFRTESSDRSDKAMPRMVNLTAALVSIYVAATVACALVFAALGMDLFDAVNHAMSTVSTGGFSTHDASFGHYGDNLGLIWSAIFFMILGSLPFVLYVELVLRGRLSLFQDIQVRVFLLAILLVSLSLGIWLYANTDFQFFQAFSRAAFNTVSIVTTTGFASDNYGLWGSFAIGLFFLLTFFGGCSGSTTGGIKIYRFVIIWQAFRRALARLVYPNAVVPLRYGERHVDQDVFDSVVTFLVAFFGLYGVMTLLLCALGVDFLTALTGVLTAMSNVGPGLGEIIGPAGNYQPLDEAETWILAFLMLIGRLEIMTVIILLSPVFWSD